VLATAETRRYQIRGIVQGVGFRPFVFRIAERHGLGGWIRNNSDGVVLEIQGTGGGLDAFLEDLHADCPALARIESVTLVDAPVDGAVYSDFRILVSDGSGQAATLVSPDTFVCEDCLRELFDPADRRYRYPFINCTNCGPRFSIVRGTPYDRSRTTMAAFEMCEECAREYHDPRDRRFHAQPVACWTCGPSVALLERDGSERAVADPIAEAAALLRGGAILAVKGIGGYHLMADAHHDGAVDELRRRKHRDEKPFAVMVGSVEAAERYAELGAEERELLCSPARPIVLVRKGGGRGRGSGRALAPGIAPGNPSLGVMLAYAPLHHLLFDAGGDGPVDCPLDALVATSGNVSEEPIAFENDDALARLGEIADAFLVHDRDIFTRVDDSIARVVVRGGSGGGGRGGGGPGPMVIRRARGYTPAPVRAPLAGPCVLAVGPELKSTICLSRGAELFLSHHIGDLKNERTLRSFRFAIDHLAGLLEVAPKVIAHDMHPGYASTRYALEQRELPTVAVQHHHAHLAACLCEHGRAEEPAIGVIFDGTGYGTDRAIWGGEFLVGDCGGFERAAHLEYFPLPGGDMAVREPYRIALALLAMALGSFEDVDLPVVTGREEGERALLARMIERGVSSPMTSSMGRLFDGVAALLGVRERIAYEAQAAIMLEQLISPGHAAPPLPWRLNTDGPTMQVEVRPLVRELVALMGRGSATAAELSLRFHCTVVEMIRVTCEALRERTGIGTVALSGGVFLNAFLLHGACASLEAAGFEVLAHRMVPTNDGGVSLGQAVVALVRVAGGRL